jgi:hypothetical protein
MRTFSTEVACSLDADTCWRLRGDFSLESEFALQNGREMVLQIELSQGDCVKRKVECKILADKVPVVLRGVVAKSDLVYIVESEWSTGTLAAHLARRPRLIRVCKCLRCAR